MNWYALHIRSNCEHLVALKLTADGIENFYPHVVTKSRDGRREIEKKFMPGYVFCCFDLAQRTHIVAITQVVGILGSGRHAVAIPKDEIESVRQIVSSNEAEPCPYFSTGQKVRVDRRLVRGARGRREGRNPRNDEGFESLPKPRVSNGPKAEKARRRSCACSLGAASTDSD
jgi:transcription antitermination factor NusG